MMQSEPFFNNSVGGNFGQASAITQNSSPEKKIKIRVVLKIWLH